MGAPHGTKSGLMESLHTPVTTGLSHAEVTKDTQNTLEHSHSEPKEDTWETSKQNLHSQTTCWGYHKDLHSSLQ